LKPRGVSRRRFLGAGAGVAAGLLLRPGRAAALRIAAGRGRPVFPVPSQGWRGDSSVAAQLRARGALPPPGEAAPPALPGALPAGVFDDLRRRFVWEYYPWYGRDPWRHWQQWERVPPYDIAATSVPLLGPYDSRDFGVLEQHARWIAESGAGAVNLSWWGPGSFEDRNVHLVMDVMHDHDIKVTFHLEPYTNDRGLRIVADVMYLLREYGEKRGWDALLLLRGPGPGGSEGPVLKGFRTILPQYYEDCRGIRFQVPDYFPDARWARQLDRLRRAASAYFNQITMLADTLDMVRARRAGFDGVAVYDNFIPPETYQGYAHAASQQGLLYSFNANPGFDGILPREVDAGEDDPGDPGNMDEEPYCPVAEPSDGEGDDEGPAEAPYAPSGAPIDWATGAGREEGARRSSERIRSSFDATVTAQTTAGLANAEERFFLVYLNSFNEWHEGHAFEPARDYAQLTREERRFGYHNAEIGAYRLDQVGARVRSVLAPAALFLGR
jgi:hypothetical protein